MLRSIETPGNVIPLARMGMIIILDVAAYPKPSLRRPHKK
jgi:hypothetical protein